MISTSLVWPLCFAVIAGAIAILFYYGGRKDQREDDKPPLLTMCLFVVFLFGIISIVMHYFIVKETCRREMFRRLNPPIFSSKQLYGYEVIAKKFSQKDSSDSPACLINIKDLLGYILLEDVKASEEFFKELKVGDRFLPEIDPNAPAAED